MFVPSNVPTLLIPFLVVIEVISHIAKMFSLSIRLFANMMSGHVLLHILMGFILKLGQQNLTFVFLPGILIGCIILLEYGISLLQGYVFLTLLAIYFEEHFGFDQEEKLEVAKLVTINGQMNYIAKPTFLKDYLAYEEREECLIYFNRREKARMGRFVYWDYTILTLIPLNKVRLSYAGNSVVSYNH